ncbi:STAS domain-containing protein [Verminephrobacter eiseniae]|uniref:Sulfate transporter/antisigma-factor antagonist STAS n=1 Tax=Verminephrobacter eiseniae (strain EF01-2) TaxID=391735 RepID=A1WKJ1_VEREI|nr:STAS domain-containing protein [Verminephrobacter eiseniae]ABM58148.1 sulfate transporter/antisigma-factor antagonist STAS [Verminephrobacter eiseniae EF01-2]MCW5232470.1 STAS domain-containing protein [Verminephrobacter eiseniae]MCW5283752.1 STAS domain-containing protein [Verminephrobacter eiseniae]MCW5295964.1 STAS domain-containing protein [Verminephrobacter eiseniae]MCW5301462.1 STAS domain-containing protein [Verminephrobacter eiseniae]
MLALPPELTQRQATACLRLLLQGLKAQPERAVRVDAKALTRFDSTALAVLLECRRAALSEGRGFAVQDLPLALAGMARLYGVDGLLTGG